MKGPVIAKEKVEEVLDKKFIRVFDLKYEEGRHYFDATRRPLEDIAAIKTEEEFKKTMLSLNRELTALKEEAKELEAQIVENIKELF